MKLLSILTSVLFIASLHARADEASDLFKKGMREAYSAHEKGDTETVSTKLKELLKIIEDQSAKKVADVLPEEIAPWKGESLKREDLSIAGGGFSISRTYVDDKKKVAVKVVKGSPFVKPAIELLSNEDLLKLSNVKTHRISGNTAAMDGEKKLHMALAGSIYLELVAQGEAKEQDLVAIARKLDLNTLEKVK